MTKDELIARLTNALLALQGTATPRFRLSQLRGCPRAQWFAVYTETDDGEPDLTTLGHFLKGRLFERWVRETVVPECVSEKEVELNGIKGHIDAFVPPDTVLEIKTTSTASIPFLPNLNHIWQVKAYLAALRWEGVEGAHGLLVYIPADDPAQATELIFEVNLTDDEYAFLLKQTELVLSDTPPPVPEDYNPERLPCAGILYGRAVKCPFYEHCWVSEQAEVTAIVPKTWIDYLGAQQTVLDAYQQAIKHIEAFKQQVESKIKEVMKSHPDMLTLTVEGSNYVLVAQKTVRRHVDIKALREDLGDDFLRPYEKEVQAVTVKIKRKE